MTDSVANAIANVLPLRPFVESIIAQQSRGEKKKISETTARNRARLQLYALSRHSSPYGNLQFELKVDGSLAQLKVPALNVFAFIALACERSHMCFLFAQCQNALIHHYHPHVALFNMTSKMHYVLHMGLIAQYINPGLGSCWQGEDLMNVAPRLVRAASAGNTPGILVQNKAMDKYVYAMSFEVGIVRC